jgi:hypothetical protein
MHPLLSIALGSTMYPGSRLSARPVDAIEASKQSESQILAKWRESTEYCTPGRHAELVAC